MSLKIIGGAFKGRPLKAPKGDATRPTQGMVREALFNICQTFIEGATFLDLFAGSGAIGLEALSRGAAFATFIEKDPLAIRALRENIALLHLESQTRLLPLPFERALKTLTTPFDLIYLDPPYDKTAHTALDLLLSRSLLAPHGRLFLEERRDPKQKPTPYLHPHLTHIDTRTFGIALLHQYQLSATTIL